MSDYADMARAMQIFASYNGQREDISAEHDEIFAGPDPAAVSAEHLDELEGLNWLPVRGLNTFRYFT